MQFVNNLLTNLCWIYSDNYFVSSVRRVVFEGEEKIVSVSFFNHVFTMPEDKLNEKLQKDF